MNSNPSEKAPPLGLRPRFIVSENRLREITSAMTRYAEASKPIPSDWTKELDELSAWLAMNTNTDPNWAAIRAGMISSEKIAAATPRQDAGIGPCEWKATKSPSVARETLMESYGASPKQIVAVTDPFDETKPDWYEQVKLRAVRHKERFGTVRTKHLMYLSAGVQSIQELRFIADGPQRGKAFAALLEADELIRSATGKLLDIKSVTTEDELDDI
jgi:hypothetical protein